MKKILLIFSTLFVLLPLFGEKATSTSTMELSAYKNGQSQSSSIENTTVTISSFRSQSITGSGNNYVLIDQSTNEFNSNNSRENAFTITISTSGKKKIKASIDLTPFINVNDNSKILNAVLTYHPSTPQTTKNTTSTNYLKAPNTSSYSQYKNFVYTPSLTLKNTTTGATIQSGGTITVNSTTTLELEQGIQSLTATRNNSSSNTDTFNSIPVEYTRSGWFSYTYTEKSTTTLPPSNDSPSVAASAQFDLSIDPSNLASIDANTDYVMTVTITITSGS